MMSNQRPFEVGQLVIGVANGGDIESDQRYVVVVVAPESVFSSGWSVWVHGIAKGYDASFFRASEVNDCESIEINVGNAEQRIRDAMSTIIHCWDEWEAQAGQESQVAQNSDAGIAFMEDQLGAVLQGMVFDVE